MPTIIFLLWTLGSIMLTINVFTPFAKQSNSSLNTILFSFVLGLLVGELLPQWIFLNLGVLLVFSFSDVFSSSIGILALICHFLCWIFLILRLWIILHLPDRIKFKMIEHFGNKWQNIRSSYGTPKSFLDIDWHSWFNPTKSIEDPRIEILRDQVFYEKKGLQLKLDIYRPKNIKKKLPGILQIHGGAWITGSKRQSSSFLVKMASKAGFVILLPTDLAQKLFFRNI